MGVHNLTWSAAASGLAERDAIEAALAWLTGGEAEIFRERVNSYHGARMTLLRAQVDRKKAARSAIRHIGADLLEALADDPGLEARIDPANNLHLRLGLGTLVAGNIELASDAEEVVKGRIKLEVYPGQDALENAREMLRQAAASAARLGIPAPFE